MSLFSFIGKAAKTIVGTAAKVLGGGGTTVQLLPPPPSPSLLSDPTFLTMQKQNTDLLSRIGALADTVGRVVDTVKNPPAAAPAAAPIAPASSGMPTWIPYAAAGGALLVVVVLLMSQRRGR